MARRNRRMKRQLKRYISQEDVSFSIANGSTNTSETKVLKNISGSLETLTTAGEEAVVTKATIRIQANVNTGTSGAYPNRLYVVGSVSDTAWTDPSETTNAVLDDILDAANNGEFEFRVLGVVDIKPVNNWRDVDSDNCFQSSDRILDISNFLREAAKQLARSALFATNPSISLMGILVGKDTGDTIYTRSIVEIEYFVQPRQLRMLGAEH